MKVLLGNRILEARRARLSVFDHGFLYGDGIYETVRAYQGRVFAWPLHHRRLKNSAARLRLHLPWSGAALLKGVKQVLRANHLPEASVRISISRGSGPLGLDPRVCPHPTLVMIPHPARPVGKWRRKGLSMGIAQVRRNHPACLDPRIKSTSSLNTLLARMEGIRMGVDETILLNLDARLTEGTISNVFFVRKGTIFTPALSCGILEGITRSVVIRLARRAGYSVREGAYGVGDLRTAAEIFLSSTSLEIMPVVKVRRGRMRWRIGSGRPGPVAAELQSAYRAHVQKCLV